MLSSVVSSAGSSVLSSVSNSSGQRVALQPVPAPEDLDRDELTAGMLVGEYQIERKIGVGGMGVVYGAKHPLIGKRAAVKVLNARLSLDREAVSRFVLEAQAVNQIGHANIVDIFSFGTLEDGRSYFVMEWLQGETLGERLDRLGKLPVREALTILVALCRALEAAHAAGVIHRDLKPDNVFLATDDEGWRVKLLDFGIAKLSTTAPSISRTATGMVVGTPLFMAPEQAKGEPVDGRTDVYALGLLAYTALCGTSLFESESSAIEVLAAHISKEPPPPRTLRPDLPVELDVLILEMLAKRQDARPSLVDVRQQLAAFAATLGAQTGPVPLAEPRSTVRAQSTQSPGAPVLPKGPTELLAVGGGEEPLVPARTARWPIAVGAVAAVGLAAAVYVLMTRDAGVTPPPPPKLAAAPIPTQPVVAPDAAVVAEVAPDAAVPVAPVETQVDITVKPADAVLTIDGAAAASPAGHAQLPLPPGNHVAVVTAGGRSVTRAFVVVGGTPLMLAVAVPVAAPAVGPARKPPPVVPVVKPVPPKPIDVDGGGEPVREVRPVLSRTLCQWLAVTAALGGLAGPARADEPAPPPAPAEDPAARASKLYDEGRLHFDIGDYAAAITAWKESYLLSSASLLLFNIGQAYRLSNNCAEANRFYFNYKRVEPNPKNQAELEQAMAKCEGVAPATSTAPTVTTEPAKPPPEPDATKPAEPGPVAPPPVHPPAPVDHGSTLRTIGLSAGTVGVLALVGGGLFALKASSDASDIAKKPIGTPAAQVADLDSSGKSAATRGKVFGIVGLVLAAGGGTLWYLGHRADSHVEVSLAPGHTEVSYSCAF